jgi:hypothetical protein
MSNWWDEPSQPLMAGGRLLPAFAGQGSKLVAVKSDASGLEYVAATGLTLTNAAADGATKGIAAFTANDFNASSGVISLDYTNAQAADATHKGFLTSADWSTFSAKLSGTGTSPRLAQWSSSSGLTDSAVGTSVLTGLTAGSVLFGDTGGVLQQDNANIRYDTTYGLQLFAGPTFGQINLGTTSDYPVLTTVGLGVGMVWNLQQVAGAFGAPTTSANNATLFDFVLSGVDGTNHTQAIAAELTIKVDGTPGAHGVPGRWEFQTGDASGNEYERLRLTSQGTTGISSPDPGTAATQTAGTDGTAPADGNTFTVNGQAYTFKTTLTPANYEVLIVAGNADSTLTNFLHAINATGGTPGTDYQVPAAHLTVSADTTITSHHATLSARNTGTPGNSLTLAKSGTHLTVGGATFAGGVDGSTVVMAGTVECQGTLWQSGSGHKLGLFNTTPVVQQAHIADASGDDATTINAILDVLEAYGLVAAA